MAKKPQLVLQPRATLPGSVTVTLPSARPDAYRRWVAFWREVEHRMLESPSLEAYASSMSVPFLQGDVASFVSDVLARQLVEQATRAQRQGKDYVVPRVTGDRRLLTAAKWYLAERGDWLSSTSGTKTMAEAMGVPALPSELVALRKRVVTALALDLEDLERSN